MTLPSQILLKRSTTFQFQRGGAASSQTDAPRSNSPPPPCPRAFPISEPLTAIYCPYSSNAPAVLRPHLPVSEGQRGKLRREGGRHSLRAHVSALERADPSQAQQDPGKLPLQVSLPWLRPHGRARRESPLTWLELEPLQVKSLH